MLKKNRFVAFSEIWIEENIEENIVTVGVYTE
jgi:hypothetical protein